MLASNHFDFIIIGTGCAGLSLAVKMIESGAFTHRKILLLDREQKKRNDRTWCFWENKPGHFESILHHRWDNLSVNHPAGKIPLNIAPYSYKMIRGADFYRYCFDVITKAENVTVVYGEVTKVDAAAGTVTANETTYTATQIFSSVLMDMPQLAAHQFYLLQHFKGWWIETDTDFFDPSAADLMNFNTSQQNGCTFVYVLPVSRRKALIEYTLFSESILEDILYDDGLKIFSSDQLQLTNYTITETEKGVIPMTNLQFPKQEGKVFFIGTAGGQTKASTGYTFQFIQRQTADIVAQLQKGSMVIMPSVPSRFGFYDSVLLRVLHERKLSGADVFYHMFQKNKASKILRFLDNDSSFFEEIVIMNNTRKMIFIPAAIKELGAIFKGSM